MAKTNVKISFKRGDEVRVRVNCGERGGYRGTGTVRAGVPKGALQGAARLTVACADGVVRRVFAKWCRAAKAGRA